MSTRKLTISIDKVEFERIRRAAEAAGTTVSGVIVRGARAEALRLTTPPSELLRQQLRRLALLGISGRDLKTAARKAG